MGIIVADLFITLDGVYQAPGAPDEDTSGGFDFGGWQGAYFDTETGESIGADIDRLQALLLGRKTYDIFADYWPRVSDEEPIAAKFNAVPKFVASRTLSDPSWAGTTVITDVATEVAAIRDRFDEIHVIGSGDLVQSLLEAHLVDRLNLWLYPITLGSGKRLWSGLAPSAFTLAEPPKVSPKGAMQLVYTPAGPPITGYDMAAEGLEA